MRSCMLGLFDMALVAKVCKMVFSNLKQKYNDSAKYPSFIYNSTYLQLYLHKFCPEREGSRRSGGRVDPASAGWYWLLST